MQWTEYNGMTEKQMFTFFHKYRVKVLVFNATFNNISTISWFINTCDL